VGRGVRVVCIDGMRDAWVEHVRSLTVVRIWRARVIGRIELLNVGEAIHDVRPVVPACGVRSIGVAAVIGI
jgi:hypothetical protein